MDTNDIAQLISQGDELRFYTRYAWKRLRREVLSDHNHECQDCKARGKYTRATMVHHEQTLRQRPDLALSKWYKDGTGRHRQLTPLCDDCHKLRHPEQLVHKKEPLNQERW